MAAGFGLFATRLSEHLTRVSHYVTKLGPSRRKMAPPMVAWPRPGHVQSRSIICPNCGSDVPKPLVLNIEFTTSPGSRKQTAVLRCPDCTCPFYAAQIPPDYADDAMLERGRVPFYLQQGAGLSLITRPLAQVRAPAGSTYLEVGCGFGFGLDYARHAKNWAVQGIDPAGIAAMGQDMLGVPIDRRYLGANEPALAGKCAVVMASETIEHVLSPTSFVQVLRGVLRPGGILILTTPDGADIRPETAASVLIGLLSPGLHLIFQTRTSLHRILIDAGFSHVIINKDGHSLVALASDEPIELERDGTILKAEYRAYLEHRAGDFPLEHDLYLAFAGRALQEAVNDAAFEQAKRLHADVQRACVARFGQSLDDLAERIDDFTGLQLEDLVERMPLSLGGLLYADAIMRLASGMPRARLEKIFLRAAAAAELLRDALGNLALADGMSEELAWTARAEAVLCSAAAGTSDVLEKLSALPSAPDAEAGALRREVITERAMVELVNAGHYQLAAELADMTNINTRSWTDPDVATQRSPSQRDALFCLAVLDSQSDNVPEIERSRSRFSRVQQIVSVHDGDNAPAGLFDAACRGEVAALERLGHQAVAEVPDTAPSKLADS